MGGDFLGQKQQAFIDFIKGHLTNESELIKYSIDWKDRMINIYFRKNGKEYFSKVKLYLVGKRRKEHEIL